MTGRKTAEERAALSLPPMTRGMQTFSLIAFFILGAALTWFALANPFGIGFLPGREEHPPAAPTVVADTVYQCPMHPEVVESGPADCPICGMDLVEVGRSTTMTETGGHGDPGVIRIDPVQVQNIGVVSVEARSEEIARHARTVGILDFDAERVTWVNTKFEGWIEKVHVNYVGQEVRQGEPLFEIYSPDLVSTQEEYLRALDYAESLEGGGRRSTQRQAASLLQSTRERLAYWDVTDEQVRRLETDRQVQRRLVVAAPTGGVVAAVMSESLEGMHVSPGMNLYKIADLSGLWAHADVYERDIPWVRVGQRALISFRNGPSREIQGKVLFLYPEVSSETRTLRICVEVPNPNRRLRPGMYADVVVDGPPVKNAIVVPQSAVIRSGERNIVFKELGEGRFEPLEVELGVIGDGDRVQVLAGVAAGDRVVTQAQFMLDSESRIQEAIAKFRQRPPASDHAH